MMRSNAYPALCRTTKLMLGRKSLPGVYPETLIKADADLHHLAAQMSGNAVAISPNIDEPIPVNHPMLKVGRVIRDGRQGLQMGALSLKALHHHFFHGAVKPWTSFRGKPAQRELIHVREAVELPIPLKKIPLDIADHPLVFALGPSPVRTAGTRVKPVVTGKVDKALVVTNIFANPVADHGGLLIVDQHLSGDPPKYSNESFIPS